MDDSLVDALRKLEQRAWLLLPILFTGTAARNSNDSQGACPETHL
jgi:hypothetical protein